MALSAHALISLLEAREFLGGEADGEVERIEDLVNAATDYCELRGGGPILSRTYADQVFDGSGSRDLLLPRDAVTAVASVDTLLTYAPVDWDPVNLTDYPVLVVTPGRRRIAFRNRNFPCGFQNVRVTYTAGWGDAAGLVPLPAFLPEACRQAVKELYVAKDDDGVSAVTVGGPTGAQVTSYLDRAMPRLTLDMLDRFRANRTRFA